MDEDASLDETLADTGLFVEPADYYQAEKEPTFTTHKTLAGDVVRLRLVGQSPLWGHLLWNAGHTLSDYLEADASSLVAARDVLELGAGAGLPGIMCARLGAEKVVITDYPDAKLVENLRWNVENVLSGLAKRNTTVEGYIWGAELPASMQGGFDLLILADLLFNHSEHGKLVGTVTKTMRKNARSRALVFFTPYRPWLLEKDLTFFKLVAEAGLVAEKVLERVLDKVMFENDRGDEKLRRTVFGYILRWPEEPLSV